MFCLWLWQVSTNTAAAGCAVHDYSGDVASGVAKCDPQSIWNPRKNCIDLWGTSARMCIYAQFRCVSLHIKKALLGMFRKLIPTTTRRTTTESGFLRPAFRVQKTKNGVFRHPHFGYAPRCKQTLYSAADSSCLRAIADSCIQYIIYGHKNVL